MQYGNRLIFHNTISNEYYTSIIKKDPGGLDQSNTNVLGSGQGSGFNVQRSKV